MKKTKADKEASKGIHDSWLDDAEKEKRKLAFKGPRGSALGDYTVNPFQAVADMTGGNKRFPEDGQTRGNGASKKRKSEQGYPRKSKK